MEQIGRGVSGTVFATKQDGQDLAIKVVRAGEDAENEIRILEKLRGTCFVVQLQAVERAGRICRLVFPRFSFTLHQLIVHARNLNADHQAYLTKQLAAGVNAMHLHRIIHRDLKPENILCDSFCRLQICDFGLSCTLDDEYTRLETYMISRWYRPPELLRARKHKTPHGQEVDVWSMGCVIGEIFARKPLFPSTDVREQRIVIERLLQTKLKKRWLLAERRRSFFETISPNERVIFALDACLREDPSERSSAYEVCKVVAAIPIFGLEGRK